ncbi:unnamed protein product [Adineta ricciae]|uniref:RING-type domain-containing protein n=1 Tax=Adineta ricciae TaxID=249248 RepID=A0A815HHY2_ADIRI|nr:unnamed protein product [Adineta ricciae]
MFEQRNTVHDGYEYVDEASIDPELICSICHQPFQDPQYTPCDDTFCRRCITQWIQTQNTSCPICRKSLSIDNLTQVNRPLRNMLNRLQVKCTTCGQSGLQRGDLDDHMNKICPKMEILCSSADIRCSWKGQREQLDEHLSTCAFNSLRYVIIPLVTENSEFKEQIIEMKDQIDKLRNDSQQLQERANRLAIQADTYQRENQRLQEQIVQLQLQPLRKLYR